MNSLVTVEESAERPVWSRLNFFFAAGDTHSITHL